MGGFRWSKDEDKLLNEAAKAAGEDIRTFIAELRKAGTTRTLSQIYGRVNRQESRPKDMSDELLRKLSGKIRDREGNRRPMAYKPLSSGEPEAATSNEATEAEEKPSEAPTNGHNGNGHEAEAKAPESVDDAMVVKHVAYCILGEQLGRSTKAQAYDDIVATFKQWGIII